MLGIQSTELWGCDVFGFSSYYLLALTGYAVIKLPALSVKIIMVVVGIPPSFRAVVPITRQTSTVLENCPSGMATTCDCTTDLLCSRPRRSVPVLMPLCVVLLALPNWCDEVSPNRRQTNQNLCYSSIAIRGEGKQEALTSKNAADTVASLNRDTTNTGNSLSGSPKPSVIHAAAAGLAAKIEAENNAAFEVQLGKCFPIPSRETIWVWKPWASQNFLSFRPVDLAVLLSIKVQIWKRFPITLRIPVRIWKSLTSRRAVLHGHDVPHVLSQRIKL